MLVDGPSASSVECGTCGQPSADLHGLSFRSGPNGAALCLECARAASPALAATFELVELAHRVGHVTQHRGLWLPFDDLLEMTRLSKALHEAIDADGPNSPPAADQFRKELP